MPDKDDNDDHIPFILKVQGKDLDRIRDFVDNENALGARSALILDVGQNDFTDEEKEKWLAVFTDPAGITSHTFPDRDGMWRARVTCADGSQIYTQLFHTANGVFRWFAETAMLFDLFHGADE